MFAQFLDRKIKLNLLRNRMWLLG